MSGGAQLAAAAALGAFALPAFGVAQSAAPNEGPKFVRSGTASEHFIPAQPPNPCHFFAPKGLRFCPDGTGWSLEREHDPYAPGLYRLDDETNAAITLVAMPYNTAFDLTASDLERLAKRHLFEDGPRGKLDLVKEISRKEDPRGRLVSLVALAKKPDGQPLLLQATFFKLNYGLGIVETRSRLPALDRALDVTEAQGEMYHAFLNAITISYNIGHAVLPRAEAQP